MSSEKERSRQKNKWVCGEVRGKKSQLQAKREKFRGKNQANKHSKERGFRKREKKKKRSYKGKTIIEQLIKEHFLSRRKALIKGAVEFQEGLIKKTYT